MNFDWSALWESLPVLLAGVQTTIVLAFLAMLLGIPGGLLLCAGRRSRFRVLTLPACIVIDGLRATPVLLQLFWLFYVLPLAFDVQLSPYATALLALALNVSVFNAEIFRAGINSIQRGQSNAALALGMSGTQVMRTVVLPQALRRSIPALANIWVSLFKNTALVSTIAVADLAYVALQLRTETYKTVEILTAMALIYWLMGYPQAKLADSLQNRYQVNE